MSTVVVNNAIKVNKNVNQKVLSKMVVTNIKVNQFRNWFQQRANVTCRQGDQAPILCTKSYKIFVTCTFYIFVTFNQYSLVGQAVSHLF
jgi:hypothetical protein